MTAIKFPKVAQLKTPEKLRAHLADLGCDLPVDDEVLSAAGGSPLAGALKVGEFTVGNRWCIHPMEGWDANTDGSPTERTLRRWRHFGLSGAKWIWGGEAAAVRPDGRANPNQTLATESNCAGLKQLFDEVTTAHQNAFGTTDDFLVGLQLTHSGRFCRPNSKKLEPRTAYAHPLLDAKFGIDDPAAVIFSDDELETLTDEYVAAAKRAKEIGYAFVDVKCCHGYLLHEFLSATTRPGKYGGDFAGRTRLLTSIIDRVQQEVGICVMVRLSIFDFLPYQDVEGEGQPMQPASLPYPHCFGAAADDPLQIDLAEPIRLLKQLQSLGVAAVNLSAGSPYYNPHIQRPAAFPPSDGYGPPEDPLVGVARQINVVRECKAAVPDLPMVGTAYSYLQDFLPHVAQAVVREGWVDAIGLGRMVLSYPTLPADTLAGEKMQRKLICRTFSDCTTAPRNGLASGCYPLDPFYKEAPEFELLKAVKKEG